MGTLSGKKGRILDIQGIKTNVIIDTGSDISIANSRYHTTINAPKLISDNISISGIGGKEIKSTGFFLNKVYVGDIEIQDKFYVVVEDVVRIINGNTVRIGYIKINEVPSKTDEVATLSINNDNRGWEDMVNIDFVNAEVDLT